MEVGEEEKFTRDVRRAFQFVSAQLVAAGLIAIIYYTYTMISELVTPFFWALIFSVILKPLKTLILLYFEQLEELQKEFAQSGFFSTPKLMAKKFLYIWENLFIKPVIYITIFSLFISLSCGTVGWGCWVPIKYIFILSLITLVITSIILSIVPSSYLNAMVSTIVVFGFLIGIFLFLFVFLFKAIMETSDFIFSIIHSLNDPKWAKYVEEIGIDEVTIQLYYDRVKNVAIEWAEYQGYDVNDLLATAALYSQKVTDIMEGDDLENYLKLFDISLSTTDWFSFSTYANLYHMLTSSSLLDQAMEIVNTWKDVVIEMSASILTFIAGLATSLLGMIDNAFTSLVFIGALMFLVDSEIDYIDTFFSILPISSIQQMDLSHNIQRSISRLFECSLLLCFFRGFFTWCYFTFMGIEFAYSAALITAPTAIFPLLSPWLLFLPAIGVTYLKDDPFTIYYAILILFSEFFIVSRVEEFIHGLMPDTSPYLTGLGLVLGVSTFGIEGILIGPMLIILVKIFFQLFQSHLNSPSSSSLSTKEKID